MPDASIIRGKARGWPPAIRGCCASGSIQQMPDSYATDAPYYDLIHDNFDGDVGLWQSFAARTDRPVLEVGTGTGRIAVELARAGHTVVGIDPSAAMLERGRKRADELAIDVTFIEGKVPELTLGAGYYGLVIVPADVFLYCGDREEQVSTLSALDECLHDSGLLALDLPGPALWLDPSTNGQPLLVYSGTTPEGEPFDAWQVHEDDLAEQLRILRVTYERTGADGLVRRSQSEHRLRYVYPHECRYLLEQSGLVQVDAYGDYDLGPLTNDSERMIVIAGRAEE
jgi:SAM-dependent methyltransferase